MSDAGFYTLGPRRFSPDGLEILVAPCSHGFDIEPLLSLNEIGLTDPVFFPEVKHTNFDGKGCPLDKWVRRIMRKEAAICGGPLKGWHGPLIDVNRRSATIETVGRHPPKIIALLDQVVLMYVRFLGSCILF